MYSVMDPRGALSRHVHGDLPDRDAVRPAPRPLGSATVASSSVSRPRHLRTQSFRHLEIRQAVNDTRCAYSTGQAQTFAAAFEAAVNHLPAKLDGQLRFV